MKLGISQLAWDNKNEENIFDILNNLKINKIETVLTKIKNWDQLTDIDIYAYKNKLDLFKFETSSIQSLFYQTQCKTIFDINFVIRHFKKIIEFARILNVNILVFGSPSIRKNCINSTIELSYIFSELDELLENTGIQVSIEPNSKIYGGDFFFTIEEICSFIKLNKYKNIKTMIDTHNVILEKLDPIIILDKYFNYINHIHISEIDLQPIKQEKFHIQFFKKIKNLKYNNLIIYEIKPTINLEYEIKKFKDIYNIG